MLRFGLIAAIAGFAAPALASELEPHGYGVVASYSAPINYRPHNGEGRLIVRPSAYREEDTLLVPQSRLAAFLGLSITRKADLGSHSTGKLILVEERRSR